jgi:hypothetical protein
MVCVLTLSVVDCGLNPSIMVSVLTLSVRSWVESQYNGKCAHLECDRSWVEPQYNGMCAHLECGRSWVGAPV